MTGKRRLLTGAVVLTAAFALVSCTGADDADSDGATSETVDSYVEITDQQGSVDGYVGALEDSEVERCEASGEGWVGEGTVTNPEDASQSYRIYLTFNDKRDTKALVQIDLPSVAAGETEEWSGKAPVSGDDLTCVLRVERFDPQE